MNDGASDQIPTNLRLLLLLEEIAKAGVPVTPTEVNQSIGLPKPTIHRLFATLEAEGFIQREIDGRGYSPGNRMRVLSAGILSSLRIRTARVAILRRLADEIGETCNISLPDRDAMVYIDRAETKWPLRIQLPIGTRVPFYCTAAGKLYLSSLEDRYLRGYIRATRLAAQTPHTITDPDALWANLMEARAHGYSTDSEEFMEDMLAVAVPIRDGHGRLMSTLSFHAPQMRLSMQDCAAHVPALRKAAAELSDLVSDTGGGPEPQA